MSYCLEVEAALVRDSVSGHLLTRVGRWPSFTSYATYLKEMQGKSEHPIHSDREELLG